LAQPPTQQKKGGAPTNQKNSAPPMAKDLPHTIDARYKLQEELGQGGFSVVRLATGVVDKKKYAIKIVSREKLQQDDEDALRLEVRLLLKLRYKNIVQAFDFFEEPKAFYVVLEYLCGGELFDRIVAKQYFNEEEARDSARTILLAIKYLHDRNIIHR
jgi:serine/threonine protein kinase